METRLLEESSHYKIYATRHITPMEDDTQSLMFLLEEEANKGFKLQTIFFYKMELLIVFSVFK